MRGGPKFLAALILTASLAGCYDDPGYYRQSPYGSGYGNNGAYGNSGGYGNGYSNGYGSSYGNGGGYYGTPPCQPVQTTIFANGQQQPVYGRACQQSDGSWRIVP
jgi:hypothetical protein